MIVVKEALLQWSIDFLIKKTSGGAIKNGNMSNKELAKELHKPIVWKFNKSTLIFCRQYLGC